MKKLQFYFRNGCHLCEDMWQQLLEEQKDFDFELIAFDIDRDEALNAKYTTLIPVLTDDNQLICHYYLDRVALHRCLRERN